MLLPLTLSSCSDGTAGAGAAAEHWEGAALLPVRSDLQLPEGPEGAPEDRASAQW